MINPFSENACSQNLKISYSFCKRLTPAACFLPVLTASFFCPLSTVNVDSTFISFSTISKSELVIGTVALSTWAHSFFTFFSCSFTFPATIWIPSPISSLRIISLGSLNPQLEHLEASIFRLTLSSCFLSFKVVSPISA